MKGTIFMIKIETTFHQLMSEPHKPFEFFERCQSLFAPNEHYVRGNGLQCLFEENTENFILSLSNRSCGKTTIYFTLLSLLAFRYKFKFFIAVPKFSEMQPQLQQLIGQANLFIGSDSASFFDFEITKKGRFKALTLFGIEIAVCAPLPYSEELKNTNLLYDTNILFMDEFLKDDYFSTDTKHIKTIIGTMGRNANNLLGSHVFTVLLGNPNKGNKNALLDGLAIRDKVNALQDGETLREGHFYIEKHFMLNETNEHQHELLNEFEEEYSVNTANDLYKINEHTILLNQKNFKIYDVLFTVYFIQNELNSPETTYVISKMKAPFIFDYRLAEDFLGRQPHEQSIEFSDTQNLFLSSYINGELKFTTQEIAETFNGNSELQSIDFFTILRNTLQLPKQKELAGKTAYLVNFAGIQCYCDESTYADCMEEMERVKQSNQDKQVKLAKRAEEFAEKEQIRKEREREEIKQELRTIQCPCPHLKKCDAFHNFFYSHPNTGKEEIFTLEQAVNHLMEFHKNWLAGKARVKQ